MLFLEYSKVLETKGDGLGDDRKASAQGRVVSLFDDRDERWEKGKGTGYTERRDFRTNLYELGRNYNYRFGPVGTDLGPYYKGPV